MQTFKFLCAYWKNLTIISYVWDECNCFLVLSPCDLKAAEIIIWIHIRAKKKKNMTSTTELTPESIDTLQIFQYKIKRLFPHQQTNLNPEHSKIFINWLLKQSAKYGWVQQLQWGLLMHFLHFRRFMCARFALWQWDAAFCSTVWCVRRGSLRQWTASDTRSWSISSLASRPRSMCVL